MRSRRSNPAIRDDYHRLSFGLTLVHNSITTQLNMFNPPQSDVQRQAALEKKRLENAEAYERQKATLIAETEKARPSTQRFTAQNDSMEDSLKKSTVGLVRLEDFQKRREELEEAKARAAARSDELK